MTYHNILSNPTLQCREDNLHVEIIHELGFPKQFIWHPVQWKTTVVPTVLGQYTKRKQDLHIIPTVWPQTVDGNQVLTIEANTKHFVVNLEQTQIPLKAHQRYLVKVLFNPNVEPLGESETANAADLSWRITVGQGSREYTDGFQSAGSTDEWGETRSALLVVQSNEAQAINLSVEFWSKWGNLDKQIYIHSIEILEVEADYGEAGSIHAIGTPSTEPPPPPPPGEDVIPTMPAWMVLVLGIVAAVVVGVLIYSLLAPRLVASAMETNLMEIISITEAGNILMVAIGAILAGGLAAPVTQPVVNVLKIILKLAGQENLITANGLSLLVAGVVSLAIWFSRHGGVEVEAVTVMDWLAVALPVIVSGLSMFLGQKGVYALSQRYDIPLFNYKRS